jgi:hypothetical protein
MAVFFSSSTVKQFPENNFFPREMILNNLKSSNLIIELLHPITNKEKILGWKTNFFKW